MRRASALAIVALGLAGVRGAYAQRVRASRGTTIVVGTPPGNSPMPGVDAARSDASPTLLPTGTLHVAWRRNLGLSLVGAPLVGARGDVTVLTARGDVVVLAANGEERSDTVVGAAAASPATLLSDGTAAFLSTAGDAVGVTLGHARFRTHLGGGRSSVAPLALADGGLVAATQEELVALDAEGNLRARVAIDSEDPPEHALVGAEGARGATVYAVTTSGAVLAWTPAPGAEITRVGAFGGPTDGGIALVRGLSAGSPDKLVAVVGAELVALDPATGHRETLLVAAAAGALALLGPPAVHGSTLTVLGLTPSRALALSIGPDGAETLHQAVGPSMLPALADGGTAVGTLPPHVGVLVDAQGAVAFALATGEVGVLSPAGAVDALGDVCARPGGPPVSGGPPPLSRGGAAVTGIAPAAPFAMVVACGAGVVARIDSDFAPAPPPAR